MKKPSLWSLAIGLVPFSGVCFAVPLWDRIHPMVLGLPFNLFWLISWILLTPLCMWGAYLVEMAGNSRSSENRKEEGA